nr:MAG TPA: hypothetical protein [Caudoviricetes sp.]
MDNVNIPAVAEGIIGGAIHNDVHNIFEQTLFAPEPTDSTQPVNPTSPTAPIESPDGTVVMPDAGPRIADDEVVNPTGTVLDETQNDETQNDEEQNNEDEQNNEEQNNGPKEQKASKAASKAFAEMRVQLRGAKKEIADLKAKLEEAGKSSPNNEELESLREIVRGYAFTATEEYKTNVTAPYNKANAKLAEIARASGASLDMDKLNEVALNPDLDEYDREEAYEAIGKELGISDSALFKFVRMAKVRDAAIVAHGNYQAEADKYVEELKASRGGKPEAGTYTVNLDNYTLEAMKERAKELGMTTEITEENVKHARHLAHKINNGSFMDGALAELMVKELADARATIEALNVKVAKLRKARPSANGGSPEAPETRPPAGPTAVGDIIGSAFGL